MQQGRDAAPEGSPTTVVSGEPQTVGRYRPPMQSGVVLSNCAELPVPPGRKLRNSGIPASMAPRGMVSKLRSFQRGGYDWICGGGPSVIALLVEFFYDGQATILMR